jgi:uncharacterized membrane protein YeaQ/YmgE (transglycosylase-associated protein family)
MSIIWMLIIGLIAGAIAKLIMPGRDPGGILVTMLLGIAGSFVGGFILRSEGGTAGLLGSIVLAAASLPGLWPALKLVEHSSERADLIQVFFRLQHHLDPMQFTAAAWASCWGTASSGGELVRSPSGCGGSTSFRTCSRLPTVR